MLRWIQVLANPFAAFLSGDLALDLVLRWQRQRAKARLPRPTKKPSLEGLEDRLVPSPVPTAPLPALQPVVVQASPPAMPPTADLSGAVGQEIHLVTALENKVSSMEAALFQEVAQVVSYDRWRVETLLGVEPIAPSQPPAGGGVGSGSGAITTAHNGSNQQVKATVSQAGQGSGSGANTNVHEAALTHTVGGNSSKQGIKPLVGSGSGSGSYGITPTVEFAGSVGSGPFYEEVGSGSDDATREVVLSAPTTHTVTINYTTGGGNAAGGVDYDSESGTLTFMPGQTVQTIQVPVLDDGTDESDSSEFFNETLSNPSGATLGIYYVSAETIAEHPKQGATDTLQWNPEKGSTDSKLVTNWYDLTGTTKFPQGFQLELGDAGVGPQTPVVFDGTPKSQNSKNAAIEWKPGMQFASMTVQNGYNALMTVDAGAVTDNGSLTVDPTSTLSLKFKPELDQTAAQFLINGGGTITNLTLTGDVSGQFILNGGTTFIGDEAPNGNQKPYADLIGAQFIVATNATLKDYSYTTLTFTDPDLTLAVNGTMQMDFGVGSGSTLIGASNGISGCYVDVNGGTLIYSGAATVVDTIAMPIFVHNGGAFGVFGYIGQSNGKLIVKGAEADGIDFSVYLSGNGSSVQLAQSSTLECDNYGYYQDGGSLQTDGSKKTDTSNPCTLQDEQDGSGTAKIVGGWVGPGYVSKAYGELNVNGNMNLGAATLYIVVSGNQSGTNCKLTVSKNLNIDPNLSYLSVPISWSGQPTGGGNWTIIAAANQLATFNPKNIAFPNAQGINFNANPNQPRQGNYQISC